MLSDESLLRLLHSIEIDFASDAKDARDTYTSALSPHSDEPSFDELIAAGWIDVVWGRISTSHELARVVEAKTQMSALGALVKNRFDETYRMTAELRGDSDLTSVAKRIVNGDVRLDQISCQTPSWVAGRLWERTLNDCQDPSTALRVWFDKWEKLGNPSLVPARLWGEGAANAFREAAFAVLESDPSVLGWEETRADLIKKQCLIKGQDSARVPSVPESLVDRVSWVFDCTDHARLREYGEIAWLVSLLIADSEAEHSGPAPHPVARRLIELAVGRADLFFMLVFQAGGSRAFLAELLLSSSTSGVACLLIAEWARGSGALDRSLIERDNRTTKAMAFADAASVFSYFLGRGEVDPKEAASLMAWAHGPGAAAIAQDAAGRDLLLPTLRGELAQQGPEILGPMVAALSDATEGMGTSKFAAALDIIDFGDLDEGIDPQSIIDAYVHSVVANAPTLSARRTTSSGATSLLRIASRAPSEAFDRFLYPVDVRASLADCSIDEWYASAFKLTRSVRVHIRILSRAVAGIAEKVRERVLSALIAVIRAGALENREEGRIGAFSPAYEEDLRPHGLERPIAADIGEAIAALPEVAGDRVLSAVLEMDEPMVLAQLLHLCPFAMRGRIRRRIEELTPSEPKFQS